MHFPAKNTHTQWQMLGEQFPWSQHTACYILMRKCVASICVEIDRPSEYMYNIIKQLHQIYVHSKPIWNLKYYNITSLHLFHHGNVSVTLWTFSIIPFNNLYLSVSLDKGDRKPSFSPTNYVHLLCIREIHVGLSMIMSFYQLCFLLHIGQRWM